MASPSKVKTEVSAEYLVEKDIERENKIIQKAFDIIRKRSENNNEFFTSPGSVKKFCILNAGQYSHDIEHFHIILLTNQNQMIKAVKVSSGTISQTTVYPREIMKMVLENSAAAVILSHNHPSGNLDPSAADINLTKHIKTMLNMIDVRVLDHIITSGDDSMSFAEKGLI